MAADNDNRPPLPVRSVPIIGTISGDGRVTILDRRWRARPRPAPQLHLVEGDARDPD